MNILEDLQKEKKRILSNISQAASEGETEVLLSESENLRKIELLIDRHNQIVLELEKIRSNDLKVPTSANSTTQERYEGDQIRSSRPANSKELGNKIREDFLRKLEKKGIHLELIKGKTIYRTHSGQRVGIATATERQPNRWFLGLLDGGFDHAVLLCQRENGEVIEIPLPDEFFKKFGNVMSRSKRQLKFNVVQRGSDILIQVPGTDGISVTSFSNNYSFLF